MTQQAPVLRQSALDDRRALLVHMRAHALRVRDYLNTFESIGMGLSSGMIGTGDAMSLLFDLDGIACLGEPRPAPDENVRALGELFLAEVMDGPTRRRRGA